ncbi:MAG: ATP-dependent DNA helicase RecG [Rhodothermales bacterium]|nr:ATP-dependent DNA helicase RecG [Rhodothermales bacterium]
MAVTFLSESIQYLKGIGPTRYDVLSRAGIRTMRDLLQNFPRRYLDRSSIVPIRNLSEGDDAVTVVGTVLAAGAIPGRRGRRFEVTFEDEDGARAKCVWFQQVAWVSRVFSVGDRVAFHGKPQKYGRFLSFSHPDFDKLDEEGPALDTGRIISLYPGSAALQKVGLTSRAMRRSIYGLFRDHGEKIPEILPRWIRSDYRLIEGRVALRAAHFPKSHAELESGIRRLKFEELFFIQLMLGLSRRSRKEIPGPRLDAGGTLARRFVEDILPFSLTAGQRAALEDITADTTSGHQMNRLIQGDVGCGKTVVAVAAMLLAVDSGFQAAFMAPTEILAEQHYGNLVRYLHPLGIRTDLLLGRHTKKEKEAILARAKTGQSNVLVGTHALIQDTVDFRSLGLAVVDEQHRFGVMQRAKMLAKGDSPHVLLMTATPIPRSLAMTLYGDLEVSVIRDLPPGRSPVDTQLYFDNRRDDVYLFLRSQIEAGRQAYVVYPLVEESEKLDLKDAQTGHEKLQALFPDSRVDLIHGRMKGEEKDAAMQRFKAGKTDILVATTVIEVGVDVPNATVMVIEHAERFGLSQLHQLRGRVGRGSSKSYCVLMADYKRSAESRERLQAMVDTTDGFRISEVDLRVRGAGDFFGTRQSGLPDLRIADLVADLDILEEAREAATKLLRQDAFLSQQQHRDVRDYFEQFYARRGMKLARVG